MYEHYLLDNPEEKEEPRANDPDYDKDAPEQYADPEFQNVWDNMDDDESVLGETPEDKWEEV